MRYPVRFQFQLTKTPIHLDGKVNIMTLRFADKLGLIIWSTNIGVQKIDGTYLQIYGMVIAGFSLQDSQKRTRFFEKIFLLADTRMEVVLGIPLLALTNSDWEFSIKRVTWRIYIIAEVFLITKKVELITNANLLKQYLTKMRKFLFHIAALETRKSAMFIHCLRSQLLALLQ